MEMILRKRILVSVLVAALIFGLMPVTTHAQDYEKDEDVVVVVEYLDEDVPVEKQVNVGVSSVCPEDDGTMTKGLNRPTNVWDISKKGRYNFSGDPGGYTLYTNYKFKGKNNYTFYVKNTGSYAMTVKAKRKTKTYASTSISAGRSATVTFSNIKKTTEFYMTFNGSSFSGYIQ